MKALHHATVTKLCSSVKQFSVNESAKQVAPGCKGICSRHHQDKEREREREREMGGRGGFIPKAKLCFLHEWTKQVAFGCNEMCSFKTSPRQNKRRYSNISQEQAQYYN